ncbi:signal peptidase I [Nocardioides nanhaiensis]|uniref:Signal peptidase I n=1 Tax=Nocardioides nanhaiensis TaxID=1476871 RepID=A0ABP8VQQ0_9ACTN
MSLRAPRLLDRLLTLGAALGGLCLAWAGVTLALGLTPLVVLSGSMAPAIGTGDLAVARTVPAAEVREGDVVSVVADSGVRVTHRVVAVDPLGGGAVELVLRGDANAGPDPQTYRVAEVERVWFHVPHLGSVVSAASGRGGTLLAGGLVLAAIGSAMLPRAGSRGLEEAARPRHRAAVRHHRRATLSLLALALVASGLLVARASPTVAAFSDQASVGSGQFVAGSQTPPFITCTNGSPRPTISWPQSSNPAPNGYRVSYRGGTFDVSTLSWLVPAPSSVLDVGTYQVSVQAIRGNWISGPSNTRSISILSVIGLGLVVQCSSG